MKYKSRLLQEAQDRCSERYEDSNGFCDEEGCYFSNAFDYIGDIFNLCECGLPEKVIFYIYEALKNIKLLTDSNYADDAWEKVMSFGSSDAEKYFMWYQLNHLNILEHGGSVPGWLTLYGESVLEGIEEILPELLRSEAK